MKADLARRRRASEAWRGAELDGSGRGTPVPGGRVANWSSGGIHGGRWRREPAGVLCFNETERERETREVEMGKKGKESRREGEGVWPGDSGSRSSRSGGRGAMGLYELGDGAHG